MKYTAAEIEGLIATARDAKLEGVELLNGDPEAIALKYNGIGPEEWPEDDLRFTYASGTRREFNFANVEFHNNCLKLARYSIPWWRVLRRFLADGSALAFYEAVSSQFGWDAYVKATSKN